MKAERQPHHTPLPREDVAVKNGDDFAESFAKLTIDKSRQSKTNGIRESETKERNERDKAHNFKKDIKIEAKTKDKEAQLLNIKSDVKIENAKEKETSKVKDEDKPKEEEQLGELCARGPDRKGFTTQSRITATPYIVAPQRNTSLSNGGLIICKPSQTQLSPGVCPPPFCLPVDPALNCNTNHCVPLQNDHSHFNCDITHYPCEVYECPDSQQAVLSPAKPEAFSPGKPEALSPGKPENYCPAKYEEPCNLDDNKTMDIIKKVTSDPMTCNLLLKDLQESYLSTNETSELQNIPEMTNDQSVFCSYGNLSPASSPQVVPRMSPNSDTSGSPPGPYSPNIPILSPNVPSSGYISDESSNNMYPPPTPPMGKEPFHASDINLEEILCEPPADKRLEEIIMQELINSGSQACSSSEVGYHPLNLPNGSVTVASILPVTIQPIPIQSIPSTPRYRPLLPKPTPDERPKQLVDNIKVQNTFRQQVNCNIAVSSPRKEACPLGTAREQFSARCSDKKKQMLYAKAQARNDQEISRVDEDGDTNFSIILSNPKEYSDEKIFAMVERCRDVPKVFCTKNKLGHTPLFLASVLKHEDPLLSKYIAETMNDVGINLNEPDKDGSTIIHTLSKEGNKCAEVINELLSLKNEQGKQCINVNMDDDEGMSPLHIAVKSHSQVSSLKVVKVLLKHGADVRRKDCKQGSTPLHFALATDKPDLALIEILCDVIDKKNYPASMENYKGNTPLHVAMAYGECWEPNTLNGILKRLLESGFNRAHRNQNGKVPLELAPDSRKVGVCC
ncbi:uncharacterized protein LOC124153499 isoform X2 [Ischnura elegans]|uniref:uncharacterized protein LOC124153499 isoform X2 n=1 Tax=Ischnura elegans TaxID=197161 RepID=UPI001ED8901C|nr:uncharacterized protein LOC124153499 isoform X2 [Ischnura elegans]XP_046382659.1 uncharacterized protein LOC124153499 isoform X2 [Ischnura elegans]